MKRKDYALKKISVLAVMKTQALFLALVLGLIGLAVTLNALAFRGWKPFTDAALGTLFGVVIVAPVYGLASGIIAALYNWAAGRTGGFQFTLIVEEKEKT
jgi:hypothetical protein